MLAAGGAIDPFWAMYQQHQNDEIKSLLEGFRIGNLVGSHLLQYLFLGQHTFQGQALGSEACGMFPGIDILLLYGSCMIMMEILLPEGYM